MSFKEFIKTKKFKKIANNVGITFCIIIGFIVGTIWFYRDELPPMSELRNFTIRSGSEVYDRNGRMIYLFAFEKRKLVSLKELPPYLVDALIMTEDKNFYHHYGVDVIGNIRAVIVDVIRMDFSQGASTITQQMARNMFLTLDKKVSRKIKEIILAVRIERNFTKDEILEIYFNKIFFGGQIYGIETASLYYFNKHARDLTLPEAATLIGMIQRPNYFDPRKHTDRAITRRNFVLDRMLKGKKIDDAQYEAAKSAPLVSDSSTLKQYASDYFIETIRLYLERKYGTDKLFEGGLRIYTPLDYDLSIYADSVMNTHMSKLEKAHGYKIQYNSIDPYKSDIRTEYLQSGLMLMENQTGYVRAIIGGRNFKHSKFNRMTQAKRQPGSSIKPIYYTKAVEKGYTPSTVINDSPISFTDRDGKKWVPQNYSKEYYGYTRMRTAITLSYNVWGVKTVFDIGLNSVTDAFQKFGLPLRATDYSCALGSYEVVPMQLISAYSAFPNGGVRVKPVFITRVEDKKGKVLERAQVIQYRVCPEDVAYIMTNMLQSVVTSGTATSSRAYYNWQSAGKTGTTDEYKDAWFIGFNKRFTLGIWAGFDNGKTIGYGAAGGNTCAPIWGPIMRKAMILDNNNKIPGVDDSRYVFKIPSNIVHANINSRTGFQMAGGMDEVFIEGMVPPAHADTMSFNFTPTKWGANDPYDLGN